MTAQSVVAGTVLWEPTPEIKNQAITTKYIDWLEAQKGLTFNDYNSLWQWSVTELDDFWQSLWEFLRGTTFPSPQFCRLDLPQGFNIEKPAFI